MDEHKTFVMPELPPLTDKDREKIMAALSYAGVLFVIPLFAVRHKSPFLQFHLRQGMALFFVEAVLMLIPFLGWVLLMLPAAASVYGLLQAAKSREWELPIIGKYARRISL